MPGEQIHTSAGRLRGQAVGKGLRAWLGIPYARPPVGALRWRAPQPLPRWRGVRDALQFGPDAAQAAFPGDLAPSRTPFSEDCLTLNLWAPTRPGPHPVMVWFHGGGFVNGGSSPAVYDGAALARRGVVVVSFNYRLGRLGFLAHPALLQADADAGWQANFGFMDQVAALHWVGQHCADFGGDPGRITAFGESAGATAIASLMGSPAAAGRFHRAILQSGNLRRQAPSLADAAAQGARWAAGLGVSGHGATALRQLRALPAAAITQGLHLGNATEQGFAGPVRDGRLAAADIPTTWAAGQQARLPLIIGANNDELGFLAPALGAQAAKAQGEAVFGEPARHLARLALQAGQPVWAYRFGQVAAPQRAAGRGAWHATEIAYALGNLAAQHGTATDAQDLRCSQALGDAWAHFAQHGRPGSAWPAHDGSDSTVMARFG